MSLFARLAFHPGPGPGPGHRSLSPGNKNGVVESDSGACGDGAPASHLNHQHYHHRHRHRHRHQNHYQSKVELEALDQHPSPNSPSCLFIRPSSYSPSPTHSHHNQSGPALSQSDLLTANPNPTSTSISKPSFVPSSTSSSHLLLPSSQIMATSSPNNPNSSTIRSLKSKLFSNKHSSPTHPLINSTIHPALNHSQSLSDHPQASLHQSNPSLLLNKSLSPTTQITHQINPLHASYNHPHQPFRRNQLTRKSSFSSSNNGPRIIRLPTLTDSAHGLPSQSLAHDHSLLIISGNHHLQHSFRPPDHISLAPKLSHPSHPSHPSHLPHSPNRLPQLSKPPTTHRPSSSPQPRPGPLKLRPSPPLPPPLSPPPPLVSSAPPQIASEWLSLSPLATQSAFADFTALLEPSSPPLLPPPTHTPSTATTNDIDLEQARIIIQGLQNQVSLLKAKPPVVQPDSEPSSDKKSTGLTAVVSQTAGGVQSGPCEDEEHHPELVQQPSEKAVSTDAIKLQHPTPPACSLTTNTNIDTDTGTDANANATQPPTSAPCEQPKDDVQQPASLSESVVSRTEQSTNFSDEIQVATDERSEPGAITPIKQADEALASSLSATKPFPERDETSGETTVMKFEDVAPGLRTLLSPNALTTPPSSPRQLTPRPSPLRAEHDLEGPAEPSLPLTPPRSRLPVPRRRPGPPLELVHPRGGPSLASSVSTEPRLDTPESSHHRTPSTVRTTPSPHSPSVAGSPLMLLHHSHGRRLRSAAGRQWQAGDWQLDGGGHAVEGLATPGRQRRPHKLAHGLRSPVARRDGLPATIGHWTAHRPTHSAGLHSLFSHPSAESGGTEAESWSEDFGERLRPVDESSVAGSSASSQAEGQLGALKSMTKLELFLAASKQRARLASFRSAVAVERAALMEALDACRDECAQLRRERDRLLAEDGWKRVELQRAHEEVGWLSKTVERLEVERSRLETRANAMANELKRAVVDLRTVAGAGVGSGGDGEGSSRGGSRIPVLSRRQTAGLSAHEGSEGGERAESSYSGVSSATGRADERSVWGGRRRGHSEWSSQGGSARQSLERGRSESEAVEGYEEYEEDYEEEEEEEEEEGTASSGVSPSSTVFADHDRRRRSTRLIQNRRSNGSTVVDNDSRRSIGEQQSEGWRDRERSRERSSVLSMEVLRPEDELFLENLVFGDHEEEEEEEEGDDHHVGFDDDDCF